MLLVVISCSSDGVFKAVHLQSLTLLHCSSVQAFLEDFEWFSAA